MTVVRLVLLILSVACLGVSSLEVRVPRLDLTALGLALLALAVLLGVRT